MKNMLLASSTRRSNKQIADIENRQKMIEEIKKLPASERLAAYRKLNGNEIKFAAKAKREMRKQGMNI